MSGLVVGVEGVMGCQEKYTGVRGGKGVREGNGVEVAPLSCDVSFSKALGECILRGMVWYLHLCSLCLVIHVDLSVKKLCEQIIANK